MTNFPNGVASFGMPLFPATMGLPLGGGKAVFVYSGYTGGASNGDFDRPFTALETALNSGKVRASRGDVVYIKSGHAENIASATAINLDLAGVSIIGLGVGNQRPTFTFTTATTATLPVTVADVLIANCIFAANFDSVVAAFTLTTAPNFTVRNCLFKDTSATDVSFVYLVDTGTTDNSADGLSLINNVWTTEDDASVGLMKVDCTLDSAVIQGNVITHSVSTIIGKIAVVAANKQLTSLLVEGNKIFCATTDATGGLLATGTLATSYGWVARNYIQALDAAAVVFWVALTTPIALYDNWYSGALAEPRAINTTGGTIYNDS